MIRRLLAALVFAAAPASAQVRMIVPVAAAPVAAAAARAPLSAAPSAAALSAARAPSALLAAPAAAPSAALSAAPAAAPVPAAPAAAASPASPASRPAALSPEAFALEGRRLFKEVLRAESGAGRADAEGVATDDEMRGRLERLPGTNPEREAYVQELFKLAGAKPSDIVLQDAGEGRHNIYVVKKGRTDRVIVVGGHHDKVRAGMGAIDNGTGATMVANLYQAVRELDTDATIVFVAFAREEEGLIGSQRYLDSLSAEQKSKIDAMINLDTLGVDGTFSWQNNSTRALLDRIRATASAKSLALTEAHLDGGDADSSSFRSAGIPALTIYGASQDVIFDIIHTGRDTMAAFNLEHYRNAYLLTLELIKSLDGNKLGRVEEI